MTCQHLVCSGIEDEHNNLWDEKEKMILRESVKNFLACHPYTHGKIGLSRSKYDKFTNYKICNGKYSIELIDAVKRESVKKFMLGKQKEI